MRIVFTIINDAEDKVIALRQDDEGDYVLRDDFSNRDEDERFLIFTRQELRKLRHELNELDLEEDANVEE